MTASANDLNPAASELRRRYVEEADGGNSSAPHAGGNSSLHQADQDSKGSGAEKDRKTYGRTRDGKGE